MSAMRRINRAGQSWPQPRHDPKPRFRIKVARLRATSARMNPAHRIGFKESTNEIAKTALLPVALAVKARVLVCRPSVGFVRALRLAKVRLAVTPGRRRLAEPFFGSSPEDRLLGRKLSIGAQAFKSVPPTEKCSALNSPFASGKASSEPRNPCAISWVSRRSRFLAKVDASKTFSSSKARRTHETACRIPTVRPIAAPSGSPAASAPAGWTDVRPPRNTRKTSRRARPAPLWPVAASPAADVSRRSWPRCRRKRTTPRSSDPRPASFPGESTSRRKGIMR